MERKPQPPLRPLSRGILPNIPTKYKPSLHKAPSASQESLTHQDGQRLRSTEQIRGRSGGGPSSTLSAAAGIPSNPVTDAFNPSDEERLRTAYTHYLQANVLNYLAKEMAEVRLMNEVTEFEEVSMEMVVGATGSECAAIDEIASLNLLVLKLEHLLRTNEFVNIYPGLTRILEDQKKCGTFDELLRALEAQFNGGITLKDLEHSSSPRVESGKGKTLALEGLIQKVKVHFGPKGHGKGTEAQEDVKSFVVRLIDSLNEVITAGAIAQEGARVKSAARDMLLDVSSMTASSKLLSRGQAKRQRKEAKKGPVVSEL